MIQYAIQCINKIIIAPLLSVHAIIIICFKNIMHSMSINFKKLIVNINFNTQVYNASLIGTH